MRSELQIDSELQLAAWARCIEPSALQRMLMLSSQPGITSFALGLPAPELFPGDALANISNRLLSTTPNALQYAPDFQPLKAQVVELMRRRGVDCHEGQVFLTAGAQQGMDLLARLLLESGGRVITEELIYTGFQQVLAPFCPDILTVPTNRITGIDVDAVEKSLQAGTCPTFIYAITEGHNPMAVSMAVSERSRLVDLAGRYGVPIIEDDAYGFLQYEENPRPPLRSFNDQWVFYVGSFSKVMAPALRVGWLVVPEKLIRPLSIIKEASDINTTTFSQRLISAFIEDDHLATHINGLVHEYKNRRDTMLRALREYFPAEATWTTPASGVFIWIELPSGINAEELFNDSIAIERVAFLPGTAFRVSGHTPKSQGLRLNFSHCSPAQIDDGISRLGRLLKERTGRRSSVPAGGPS